jgi:uncharacterized protein YfaS (alpha-2-macroglobulin family)
MSGVSHQYCELRERDLYETQYSERISLIASQMAGRPIRRSARLKVLTTTSLYGVGSSQYNP